MRLSNIEIKKTASTLDLAAESYVINPDLLDILRGFFQSKGFNTNTSEILSTNLIISAIEDGTTTEQDLLALIKKGGDLYAASKLRIQKSGKNYNAFDKIRFKYPGVLEEVVATVTGVDSEGGITSINIEDAGLIEIRPRNPISPSSTTGTGKDAFFIVSYENTMKPNAELSELASYLLNSTRFPSSFTGITEAPEDNKVYKRLIV
jgi:hypothetical protein